MSFIGNLEGVSLSGLLQSISHDKLTGIASVTKDGSCVRLVFKKGRVVYANSVGEKRLGERLTKRRLLTPDQLDMALREQRERRKHTPLASVLIQLQLVNRDALESETRLQIGEVFKELLSWKYGIISFKPRTFDDQLFILHAGVATEELLLDAAVAADETKRDKEVPQIESEFLDFLP